MQDNGSKSIRVRYDQRETGWAAPLQADLAVIENIPLTERCNLGDIVRLEAPGPDGLPLVGEVVHQRYTAKTVVHYSGWQELKVLCALLQVLGCETEGARPPLGSTPGALLVAHDGVIRPDLLAYAAGFPQPIALPIRVLIPGGTLVADAEHLRVETEDGSQVACWRRADWSGDPAVAVRALDTLHRCLSRTIDAAQEVTAEPPTLAGAGPELGKPAPGPQPQPVRFRRRRYPD